MPDKKPQTAKDADHRRPADTAVDGGPEKAVNPRHKDAFTALLGLAAQPARKPK